MKKCLVCEKENLIHVEDIILEIEGYVFILKGERCTHCNEEFPYEDESQKAITVSRKLGVWPLSKSGGGLMLRVPADLEKQLKLNEKTEVAISKIGNKNIIESECSA